MFAVRDAAGAFFLHPIQKVRNAKVSNATVTKVSDCDVQKNPDPNHLCNTKPARGCEIFLDSTFVPLFSAPTRPLLWLMNPTKKAPFPPFLWLEGLLTTPLFTAFSHIQCIQNGLVFHQLSFLIDGSIQRGD